MKKSILKILFSGILACLFCMETNAAPTIKKLGTPVETNTVTLKSNASTPSRASSVRFDTTKTTTAAPKKVSSSEVDSTRMLPSSKYLQVVHSIKPDTIAPTGSSVTPMPSSEELVVIKDQITSVERDVETLRSDLDDHINDTDIHVTPSEKESWDGKQDALEAGKGIEIEGNVISATMKLPVGSETAPHTAPIWVE